MIIQSIFKSERRYASLGDPPAPYYNNAAESANALIKRCVGFQKNEMSNFCEEMSKLIQQQKEDVESSIINRGLLRLPPKFTD